MCDTAGDMRTNPDRISEFSGNYLLVRSISVNTKRIFFNYVLISFPLAARPPQPKHTVADIGSC